MNYESYNLSLKEKLKYILFTWIGSALIIFLFYKSIIAAIILSFLPIIFLKKYSNYLAKKRKEIFNNQFKDALYSFSASFAAGRKMSEAIGSATENLQKMYGRNCDIVSEFSAMTRKIIETNQTPESVLLDLGNRTNISDIREFAEVYSICVITGGDVEKVILKATEVLTEKINMRRDLKTLISQKKLEAKILTIIPLFILAFLQISSTEYLNILYETFNGRIIMTIGLFSIVGAYMISEKITDINI